MQAQISMYIQCNTLRFHNFKCAVYFHMITFFCHVADAAFYKTKQFCVMMLHLQTNKPIC